MFLISKSDFGNRRVQGYYRRQAGATLIEAMIGLALSLVVTTSMVTLMGNSMGSATRIIQMSQLTDELRNAMSMMSRDVRRANYNPFSLACYDNSDCGVGSDTSATRSDDLAIVDYSGGTANCLLYWLERATPSTGPGALGFGSACSRKTSQRCSRGSNINVRASAGR